MKPNWPWGAVLLVGISGAAMATWMLLIEGGSSQSPVDEAPRVAATAMAQAPAGEKPIVVVNGESIGSRGLRAMLALQPFNAAQGVPTATPQEVADGFVTRVLLRQEARRRGIECDDSQTTAFIDTWRQSTPPEVQQRDADARSVPLDRLETDPEFVAMMRNFCSEGAVKRAIAAEHLDMPFDEAVDRAVAELRAKAEIAVDLQAIEAIASDVSPRE